MRMPSFVSTAILLDRKKRKKRRDLILPGKVRIDGFEKRNPQAAFVDLGIWERRKKKRRRPRSRRRSRSFGLRSWGFYRFVLCLGVKTFHTEK